MPTSADFVKERPKILLGVSNTAAEMDVFAASRFKNENIVPRTEILFDKPFRYFTHTRRKESFCLYVYMCDIYDSEVICFQIFFLANKLLAPGTGM